MVNTLKKPRTNSYKPGKKLNARELAVSDQQEASLRDSGFTGLDYSNMGEAESSAGENSPTESDADASGHDGNGIDSSGVIGHRTNRDGSRQKISHNPSFRGGAKAAISNKIGPTGLVLTLAVAFFGLSTPVMMALGPFSLLANTNLLSTLSSIQPFNDNMGKFRLLGSKGNGPAKKAFSGISTAEIKRLQADGVKLNPEGGHPNGKKFVFDSIEIDGKVVNANNWDDMMKNTKFAGKLQGVGGRGIYKATRNGMATAYRKTKNIILNSPDLRDAKNRTEFRKAANTIVNGTSSTSARVGSDSSSVVDSEGNPKDVDASKANVEAADELSGGMQEAIDNEKRLAQEGLPSEINPGSGDLGSALDKYQDADLDNHKSTAGKAWSYVNSLDVADAACTAYQMGTLSATLAKTVAVLNIVKYASSILAVIHETQSTGNWSPGFQMIAEIFATLDSAGRAWDSSSLVQYFYSGEITNSQPPGVSAVGSETLMFMLSAMAGINSIAGFGNEKLGRSGLKHICGIATNVYVQVAATVSDWAVTVVAGVLTGGVGSVAIKGGQEVLKKGIFSTARNAIKGQISKVAEKFASKEARKEAVKSVGKGAWRLAKDLAKDPWTLLFLGMFLMQTFGSDYIISVLSGNNALQCETDGVRAAECVVTGKFEDDKNSNIAAGASATTPEAWAQAEEVRSLYAQLDRDVETEKAGFFDITNPLSTIGSIAANVVRIEPRLGSPNIVNRLKAMAALPIKTLSSALNGRLSVKASANMPSQEAIYDLLKDDTAKEKDIAITVTGSIYTFYNYKYSYEYAIERAEELGYIEINEEAGTIDILPNTTLTEHMDLCNNVNKTAIDDNAVDEEILYPDECKIDTISSASRAIVHTADLRSTPMANVENNTSDGYDLDFLNNVVTYVALTNPEDYDARAGDAPIPNVDLSGLNLGVGNWLSGVATPEKGNTNPAAYFGNWRGSPIQIGQTWPHTLDMWGINPSIANSWGNFDGPMSVSVTPGSADKKPIDQNGHKGWRGWSGLANGENDSWWREAARKMKQLRAGKGITFVSPMYEFNGDWMYWSVRGDVANFKKGWERMYRIWKEEYPEAVIVLPAACNRGVKDEDLPNPNSYDMIGCTIYNAWPWQPDGQETMAKLEKARLQAEAVGKPIGITEWANSANGKTGGGGGDAPGFIIAMHEWMSKNAGTGPGQLTFETFFNIDGYALDHRILDSNSRPSSTQPRTAEAYRQLWGPSRNTGTGETTTSSETSNSLTLATFGQCDERWGNIRYSLGNFCSSACGVVSTAMIIATLKKAKNQYTPDKILANVRKYGGETVGIGSDGANLARMMKEEYGLRTVNIPLQSKSGLKERIENILDSGGIILTSGKGSRPYSTSGHFVVIYKKLSNGKWLIGDPAGQANTSALMGNGSSPDKKKSIYASNPNNVLKAYDPEDIIANAHNIMTGVFAE